MSSIPTIRRVLLSLLPLALLGAFIAVPLSPKRPNVRVTGRLPFEAGVDTRTYEFRLGTKQPELTFGGSSRLGRGRVSISFVQDGQHNVSRTLEGRDSFSYTFSFGKPFEPGVYRIVVTSRDAAGTFEFHAGGKPPLEFQQKLYLLLLAAIALLWLRILLVRCRRGSSSAEIARLKAKAGILGFGLVLALIYPIIHEAGHAIPMLCFGAFSLRGSDFIGLRGTPHVNYLPGVTLQPWQSCIVSLGGPLLPTLVGWMLLVAWAFIRRRRGMGEVSEAALLWVSGVLMVGQAGAIIPILGLARDGDYTGFVSNLPAPLWVANGIHLAILAANVWAITIIARRLLRIGNALRGRLRPEEHSAQAG